MTLPPNSPRKNTVNKISLYIKKYGINKMEGVEDVPKIKNNI